MQTGKTAKSLSLLDEYFGHECHTVFHGMSSFYYFLNTLKSPSGCQVKINTFLIQLPEKSDILWHLFNELSLHPTLITIGTSRYVSEASLKRETRAITKQWPKIKLRTSYGDHRKCYYIRWHEYNGAVLGQARERLWLSTTNLQASGSQNATVEIFGEQLKALRDTL